MTEVIAQWREATEQVAEAFIEKYFPEQEYNVDTFWVANRVGDVFCISDWFFDVDRMIEAIELNATFEQVNEYYDAEVEHHTEDGDKPMPINFKNYVKYGFNPKQGKGKEKKDGELEV